MTELRPDAATPTADYPVRACALIKETPHRRILWGVRIQDYRFNPVMRAGEGEIGSPWNGPRGALVYG